MDLALWPSLAEKNAFPPPSKVRPTDDGPELDALYARLVERFAADLPGPLPKDLFDPASARAAGALVARALARLDPALPLGRRLLETVMPAPVSPAAHVTQAALLWHAVPIARRMRGDAFRALNRGESGAEAKEAVGEWLGALLAARPLLSFRHDAEEVFAHSPPPPLEGFLDALGLRRWLLQRIASPTSNAAVLSRRALTLRQLEDVDRRDLLVLGPPEGLLPEFVGLLDRGQWPEDLAPDLRRRAQELKGSHEH